MTCITKGYINIHMFIISHFIFSEKLLSLPEMLSTLKVEHFRTTQVEAHAMKYPDLTRSESIFHSYIYVFIYSFVCFKVFYFLFYLIDFEREREALICCYILKTRMYFLSGS